MNEMIEAVVLLIKNHFRNDPSSLPSEWSYGTWQSTETVDSNLSYIRLSSGDYFHGVPKAASVTGLNVGDTILVATPRSGTMMIIAKQSGNPTSYVAPEA